MVEIFNLNERISDAYTRIPVTEEMNAKYPKAVQDAWVKFDNWWHGAKRAEEPVSRSSMPEGVKEAMDLICATEIPDADGAKGDQSCYMISVNALMVD